MSPLRQEVQITVLSTLEGALNLDRNMIRIFLGRDGVHYTERSKVHCRHFLVELFRQEIDVGLESRAFLQQIKLCQHFFCGELRHQEGTKASGATPIVQSA